MDWKIRGKMGSVKGVERLLGYHLKHRGALILNPSEYLTEPGAF